LLNAYNARMTEPEARPFETAYDRIAEVASRFNRLYGPRRWHSHAPPIDELIATILSQHTSDVNTERAFASLKRHFPTWDDVIAAPTEDVAEAIRSGGLANVKAPRIQAVLRQVAAPFDSFALSPLAALSVAEARAELERLPGVGPKTASCVLLFSLGMPAMPVDTHVYRVTRRLGLVPENETANAAQDSLECLLGADREEVYAFHLNVIAHGRRVCVARRPRCDRCVLTDCCDYYAHLDHPSSPPA
jgi:endonuclease-3